ncbi:MAG: ABC transporter ATP-binding protein [Chlorobiaceae bacterium]|nr:ABC transporter ATP-binding protein [Chlorobiaceae bacterium]
MILVKNIVKRYQTRNGYHTVLDGISFSLKKGEKIGILGRNGAGKSTLIRLLGGIEDPDSGTIRRDMKVSWPLASKGGFQGSLTGADNLRFICRIYGVGFEDKMRFVEEFSELGKYMHEPLKSYSSGMRSRLAFAMSMVIEFDCYLIDEAMSAGDARFRDRCRYELLEKRSDRSIVMVSHDHRQMRQFCNVCYVLQNGALYRFDNPDAAFSYYKNAQ